MYMSLIFGLIPIRWGSFIFWSNSPTMINVFECFGHPVPYIILMEATGKRIFKEIRQDYPDFQKMERLILTDHLEDAVKEAQKLTRPGHSCLMSPAAASYGIFKNFEERGEVFARLVLK